MISKKLFYIVESANWSIRWDGHYIVNNLKKIRDTGLEAEYKTGFTELRNCIIHFGSRNLILSDQNYKKIHPSNTVVFTWFHGTDEDKKYIEVLPKACGIADIVHTSCTISKKQLIGWGVDPKKIVQIPLGIETRKFKKYDYLRKFLFRRLYSIKSNYFVIGSFQKDGQGWDEGYDPKLIKGPDVFCNVIEQINKQKKVFIVLTGPARGYVKKRLIKANIPFKHIYLKNYREIPRIYNLLDLYIVASRAEGGPKAILESMACGVPIISTNVGMAPDIIVNGKNGFINKIEDEVGIVANALRIYNDKFLTKEFIENGIKTARKFDWKIIANKYYQKIYKTLI